MSESSYQQYVRNTARGMLTAPIRIADEWPALRDGLFSLWRITMLALGPVLLPLCPLFAVMIRHDDRITARQCEEIKARLRRNIHQNGGACDHDYRFESTEHDGDDLYICTKCPSHKWHIKTGAP